MLYWIAVVICFIITYGLINDGFRGYYLDFVDWVVIIALGACASAIGILVVVGLAHIPATEPVLKDTVEITALKDNSDIQGSFYLGSGSVDEETYYYYMTETNKGKKMEKAIAKRSYLNEGEAQNTYVEIYDLQYSNGLARLLFGKDSGYDEYVFYIPKDSVTNEFNVDME